MIGIIGCGLRIKHILRKLLSINPDIKLEGFFDPDPSAVEEYIREFGKKEAKVYENYIDLIKDPEIKWIFIGSPNKFHKDQIIASFNECKNVFCEKPIATKISDCKKIKEFFDLGESKFIISYPLRYSRHYQNMKKIIDSGKIGKIISLEFNEVLKFNHGSFIMRDWRRFKDASGGHLLEKCCHDLDLVNYLLDSKAKKIASFGGLNIFTPPNYQIFGKIKKENDLNKFEKYINWTFIDKNEEFRTSVIKKVSIDPFCSDKDIIDNQVAIIEYENGVRATFHTNLSSGLPERRMYICGTEGTIRADLLTGKIEVKRIGPSDYVEEIIDEGGKSSHGGGDILLARKLNEIMFEKSVLDFQKEKDILDAIKSAVTAIKIDEARETGQVIDLKSTWEDLSF